MWLDGQIWLSLIEIIWINVLLSGDNAVVIALACRSLPARQQTWGMILGTVPAVVLRVVFAVAIVYVMQVPYLKLVGGLLLFWIAVKMMVPEPEPAEDSVAGAATLFAAVRTIVVADVVMSLDNVIAITAAARGQTVLMGIGLAISMPMIIFGSAVLLKLLARFPMLVTAGSALLGYIAGEVAVGDPAVVGWAGESAGSFDVAVPVASAILTVAFGRGLNHLAHLRRRKRLAARSGRQCLPK
jgi:YjbE family integral membrane protein